MPEAQPTKMHRVELFIEVPANVSTPDKWNWDSLVNGPDTPAHKNTPVRFVLANQVTEGTA